jgi:hypothetical protein
LRVAAGVATGVGAGTDGLGAAVGVEEPVTVTVGPSSDGCLPTAVAWKVTARVPGGSRLPARYVPWPAVPVASLSVTTTEPTVAVTLLGSFPL